MEVTLNGCETNFSREDDAWIASLSIKSLEDNLTVEVYSLHDTIDDDHAALLGEALQMLSEGHDEIKKSLFQYFIRRRAASETVPDVWGDDFSLVTDIESCWTSLSDMVLHLEIEGVEEPTVMLSASCDWQLDGGLRAVYRRDANRFDFPD